MAVFLLTALVSSAQQQVLAPFAKESSYRVIIHERSSLKIHGKTNVNRFVCGFDGQIAADTLFVQSLNTEQESILRKATLKIAVCDFDCGMKQMTQDMMGLLQAESFPHLLVTVMGLRKKGDLHESVARFTIAGKTKDYVVPLTAKGTGEWTYCVGRNVIDITDFGLEPPSKFLGAVRVRETIEVEFNLILKIVEVR